MKRNTFVAMTALILVGLLLVPTSYFAQTNEYARDISTISPGLKAQMEQAGSDELITVIVKMSTTADLDAVRGQRLQVFSELRSTAERSQRSLVNDLRNLTGSGQVGVIRQFWIDNLVLVQATPDVINQIAARKDVQVVFENYTFTVPPRPDMGSQAVQAPTWDSIDHIGAKDVWSSYGFTGTGIRVGGLDTGVDINHPDLAGKMITNNPADPTYPGGWAEFDGDGNPIPGSTPHDSAQHGTHTSGTMIGGNASGYDIGVAPGANLMHGLVIPGGSGSFAQVAGGMEWIIDPDGNPMTDDGADVVNMSLGATGTYDAMVAPTDNMVAADVFPSFSIGNSGPGSGTTGSPGNVPSAFGVGATDMNDVIASFSSRGPVTWNSPPYVGTWTKPDISAPGVDIYSSVPGGGWEGGWDGTSMAAPHLSGTVALIRQANPTLTVPAIKQILAQTALDLGAAGMDNDYGYGRVNCFAAVSAALAGIGTLEGTVYSSAGGTVSGAMVHVSDTGQKVYSDASGHYTIQLVAGSHDLEFSAFGYDPETITVMIEADMSYTEDVTLTQLPSGYIAGNVTDAGTGSGIAADVSVYYMGTVVRTTTADATTGAYSVTLPVGSYDVVFTPPFPYPRTSHLGVAVAEAATTPLDVTLSPAQVLLVDNDGGGGFDSYFEQAIMAAGRSYLKVDTAPTAAEMATFEAVVWLTGNNYTTTLTAADEAALATYLDAGGRLFISGQDVGYNVGGDAFYADYLHADYVQDDVGLGAVNGNPANPVGFGFSFDIQGGSGANNQAYPDEIDVLAPAMPAFYYDPNVPGAAVSNNSFLKENVVNADGITSSGAAGLSVDTGAYRLVYFAFGFEAIADANTRTEVMDRVLDWLQGFPDIVHTPLGDTEDTEHPYEVTAVITSDYFTLDPSTFAVVYDVGSGNVTVPMTATGAMDEYHAYIPAQSAETDVYYYITASDVEGHTSTHPLGAPINRHMFKVGSDTEPPTLVHTPYRDTNDLTGPYCLRAEAFDNIGIESVYLVYRKNGGVMHRAEMMMNEDGLYEACIPGPSMVGDYYEYAILAMDDSYSGLVTRFPETGYQMFNIVEEFVWDFEDDDGGFTQAGDVWEWGSPTSGPGAAHSGVNVWATQLGSDYPSSADATLDIPEITIGADKPYTVFSFWHWYNMENRYDGGNVKISTDGGATWTIITPAGGYDDVATSGNAGIPGEPCFTNNQGMWEQEIFDLSAYAGQSITLRFHFGSDGSVTRPGWYLDDGNLRSTSTDDVAPVISNVDAPASTFDTAGPYTVTADVSDLFSGLASVSLFYTTDDGATWNSMAMTSGGGSSYSADIPGQPNGTRVELYITASDNASNETMSPHDNFAVLPSADILVMVSATTGASLADFQAALEANGHQADYWNMSSQGTDILGYLHLYDTIILDERSSVSSTEQAAYSTFLGSGAPGAKKGFFIMGRDLGFYSSTRPFISEWFRADYVQDNPGYYELTGEPGDPIGQGETFVISGSYPDETQRSTAYPGGEIVYRFTGEGTLAQSRDELADTYLKDDKQWDGVMPNAPKSLDAAAGIRYSSDSYRSVYFTFNFDYIQEPSRRADIADRVIRWMNVPEIVHSALGDTEDTLSAYVVTAEVYSDDLDPARVKLHYDVGGGWTDMVMTATGNPDEFSASIPAQSWGTTVKYYLSAANTDGNTGYDPASAPATWHSFLVTADNQPPVIVHTPVSKFADTAGPYPITATITDNGGVDPSGVTLTYRKNGGATTTIAMTNTSGDEYEANIPGPSVYGDVYDYYILARDLAAVPNQAREPAAGWHSFEIVDFFAWDFEADDGGFAAGGPDWEWGAPTTGPTDAHSGVNVWGTQLGGNYSSSSNSTLETPPVVVPGSKPYASLSFWQWYYIETNYDGGNVKISTDGGSTWTLLAPDIGYNGTASSGNAAIPGEPCFTGYNNDEWHLVTFDLTPYKGQSVIVRLTFGSDSSVQRVGWYVDDMRIEGLDDTEGPVFASASIPSGTFDTVGPYTVTAVVNDALSGVSNVDLHYSVDDGATWSTVAMTATGNPDEYAGDIPGQSAGTRIRLYMEATDNMSNATLDPDGAPATYYEFGVMPSGDFLVLLGGGANTDPIVFQQAFAAAGRTADIWNWDDLGVPGVAILEAYQAVVIDESWYFDATQIDTLSAWLSTNDGTPQKVFMMGRDMSYGSTARPFMEQYTGAAYVKDDPSWRQLTSTLGDPIGNDETFTISGSYPDELQLSTTYPGAVGVYKFSGVGSAAEIYESPQEHKEFYEKYGKEWDPKLWPLAPAGPDSLAGVRYVGSTWASVYFSFNFNYIQEDSRRTGILDRALAWLDIAATKYAGVAATQGTTPEVPDQLMLKQNFPNPFNPTTRIVVGIPNGHTEKVSLKVYNVRGQLVATLFDGTRGPGYHTFQWDGVNNRGETVSSGIYFARMLSGRKVLTRKMVMLK